MLEFITFWIIGTLLLSFIFGNPDDKYESFMNADDYPY